MSSKEDPAQPKINKIIKKNPKQKETHRLREQTYGCGGRGMMGWGRIVREFRMDMYTLLF